MLEDALCSFAGAVVLVSHDRFFLSKIATSLLYLNDNQVQRFEHDYRTLLDRSGTLREKVEGRYVDNSPKYRISNARENTVAEKPSRTKNFGGSGLTSGNPLKGVKNAKRMRV